MFQKRFGLILSVSTRMLACVLFTPTENSKAFLFNRVLEFTPCNIFHYHYMIHPKILPYKFKLNFSLVMLCNCERNADPAIE